MRGRSGEKLQKIDGTYGGKFWVEISQNVFFPCAKGLFLIGNGTSLPASCLRLCTVVTSINHASHTDQKHKNKDGKLRIILDAKKATAAWNVCSTNPWGIVKFGCQNFLSSKITALWKHKIHHRIGRHHEGMRNCQMALKWIPSDVIHRPNSARKALLLIRISRGTATDHLSVEKTRAIHFGVEKMRCSFFLCKQCFHCTCLHAMPLCHVYLIFHYPFAMLELFQHCPWVPLIHLQPKCCAKRTKKTGRSPPTAQRSTWTGPPNFQIAILGFRTNLFEWAWRRN